jgi:hypothetical protein
MPYLREEEPIDPLERAEFYRMILDAVPEYRVLTQDSRQVWSLQQVVYEMPMLGINRLRSDIKRGRLPGTIEGTGNRSTMIPRSSLTIYIGRLVTGWYKAHEDDGEDVESERTSAG